MMWRGSINRIIPVRPEVLKVKLPAGKKASAAKLLMKGDTLSFKQDGDTVQLTINSIDDYEVVAIDLK